MNIIIVGNGTSVLDKKLGNIIDSFDKVVRFNAYEINKFQEHVGKKTNIWFNTINFQNKDRSWRMSNEYEKIYLHSWNWRDDDKLYQDFLSFYDGKIDIIKTKKETIFEIQEYISNSEYFTYSTGVISIWMMLRENTRVYVTGFDWWEREEHHYSDKQPRGTIHKPEVEKILIDKLVSDKKVILI